MATQTPSVGSIQDERVWQRVRDALKDLRYGSVEVLIHDGKVVQIERKEKLRFDTAK